MGQPSSSSIIFFIVIILLLFNTIPSCFSGPIKTEFIYPNFTTSNFLFVDNSGGTFLTSRNGTYKASIFNPGTDEHKKFYFSVIHVSSHTIIWSANRNTPMSDSDELNLTSNGITILGSNQNFIWSTPSLKSSVYALQLKENGNLVLLDKLNVSLWESFDYATDTVVVGQKLKLGDGLISSKSDKDLSSGDYKFYVAKDDGYLQWNGLNYWKLTMYSAGFKDKNAPVSYMVLNSTGLYLMNDGLVVVIRVPLPSKSDVRIVKLESNGRFMVSSYSDTTKEWNRERIGPENDCQIPNFCGRMGVCVGSTSSACACPSNFHTDPNSKGCEPVGSNSLLPSACNSTTTTTNGAQINLSEMKYAKLSPRLDYYVNQFLSPDKFGVELSVCEDLCSKNCSCLGFFFANTSGTCYLIRNQLGSMLSIDEPNDKLGYIKMIVEKRNGDGNGDGYDDGGRHISIAPIVLLPSTAVLLVFLFLVAVILYRRRRRKKRLSVIKSIKLGRFDSSALMEFDFSSIPGLPVRYDYSELEAATEKFSTQIGAGGFGTVYKGTLPDKTLVAVKKIINLGVQGRKEFYTEIAIIGKVHHVNLVKLRGFCAEGQQKLLVYEFMNRSSLDRTLFGAGPVLEWQERFDIALGTARGLAYLHSGCEHKIIHCDIKPENILLHDNFQVKISDFGLSKLLSPELSSHFTTMRGTRGYLAPEWLTSSAISDKTDVYSYGMVLLEIVSGRKNCSMRSRSHSTEDGNSDGGHSGSGGNLYFPLFALEMHEEKRYTEIADPKLEGRVSSEEVEKLVKVALCCVHEEPALRPTMMNVVGMLEGGTPVGEPRPGSLNFLRFYGRRFTESSVLAGSNNVFTIYEQVNTASPSTATNSSYLSSQQISGPR
ncbi:G-type lectin S-receptor-like serine/threonine-protein kinase At5g35370 isoform X1 [Papaver somniferum]|nr:G-type lectin S-receptor-like serine/threonine-protein kinase At5g35370 isoform X1 [Papaver somniferum]XP_026455055.1 G-type lectin S-receptor-like serine/threonine-protein kinase At5g35370 isoform X1 [Papaver somniferum]